jgi:hypothetical protein
VPKKKKIRVNKINTIMAVQKRSISDKILNEPRPTTTHIKIYAINPKSIGDTLSNLVGVELHYKE